jgi:hypothetical protein
MRDEFMGVQPGLHTVIEKANTIIALLTRIAERLDVLATTRPSRPLARQDRETLTEILPAMLRAVGDGVVFTIRDLAAYSESAGLRPLLARMGPPPRLGRLFQRAHDVAVGAYTITRVGADRDGALWRISMRG